MKQLRTVYVLLLCFLLSHRVYSQDIFSELKEKHPHATLREIMQIADRYFEKEERKEKKHDKEKEKNHEEEEEEGEYFQYKRWEFEQLLRFGLDEVPSDYSSSNLREFHHYLKQQSTARVTNNFTGNWRLFGPSTVYGPNRSTVPGIGRVNVIVPDPTNHNILYIGTPNTGLWRSTDNGANWTSLNDGMSQIGVSGIVIDKNSPTGNRTIYILTGDGETGGLSGGVLVSYNNGSTWYSTAAINSPYAHKLKQNPYNNNLLIASYSGVLLSANNGASWTNVQTGNFADIEFHPTNSQIIYASTMDGKYFRSANAGSTWTLITTGLANSGGNLRVEIAVSPHTPNRVYLVSGSGTGKLARSDDSGLTFTLTNAPDLSNGLVNQTYYNLAIAASPVNGDIVHIGGLYASRSTDGGVNFNYNTNTWDYPNTGLMHTLHADLHDLIYIGNDTVYAACDGGVYRYKENVNGWDPLNNGLAITQFYKIGGHPINDQLMLGGSQDNGLGYVQQNMLTQWQNADGMETFIDPTDQNIFYGMLQNGQPIYKSLNGGTTAIGISPPPQAGEWTTPFCMDPNNNQKLYVGYKDVLRSSNQGTNWTNISNGQLGTQNFNFCHVLSIAPSNSNVIYVFKPQTAKLFITENGGTNWTEVVNPAPSNTLNDIVIHPQDPKNIWVTSNGLTKVYHSINGGLSWTSISGSLPNLTPLCLIYQKNSAKNRLYLGMDAGIYYLDDNHSDWQLFTDGLPIVQARDFEINYKTNLLRVGTYGRGIWETEMVCDNDDDLLLSGPITPSQFGGKITATDVSIVNNNTPAFVAKDYIQFKGSFNFVSGTTAELHAYLNSSPCSISARPVMNQLTGTYNGPMPGILGIVSSDKTIDKQNRFALFPNPATDITNLDFTIDAVSQIEITVHDMKGTEIGEKIISSNLSPGKYEYNLSTTHLPNGAYLVTLKINNEIFTKTLSIVK
jgi:photosystem II stability/assembly factor-like uncharacterized protein